MQNRIIKWHRKRKSPTWNIEKATSNYVHFKRYYGNGNIILHEGRWLSMSGNPSTSSLKINSAVRGKLGSQADRNNADKQQSTAKASWKWKKLAVTVTWRRSWHMWVCKSSSADWNARAAGKLWLVICTDFWYGSPAEGDFMNFLRSK